MAATLTLKGSNVDMVSKTLGCIAMDSGPKLWFNVGWNSGCEGGGI